MAHVHKEPTTCPHCGFNQPEPLGLISTYCRGCGTHYAVAHGAKKQLPQVLAARFHDAIKWLRKKIFYKPPRHVICYQCSAQHDVSVFAETTLCPGCGVHIELEDVTIGAHTSQTVDTWGFLHVRSKGFLNNSMTRCGSALVEGRIAGLVRCEGILRFKGTGNCRAELRATQLIFERRANVTLDHSIEAKEVVIRGIVHAHLVSAHTITIARKGCLISNVEASSLRVERGGTYSGKVQIAPSRLT